MDMSLLPYPEHKTKIVISKKGNIKPLWNDIAFFYSIFHFWTVGDAGPYKFVLCW